MMSIEISRYEDRIVEGEMKKAIQILATAVALGSVGRDYIKVCVVN